MSTATTSLTLRALFSRAASRTSLDKLAAVTAGLSPAAKALAAVAAGRSDDTPTLLVVPTDKDVEQIIADARFFYRAMEGASDTSVEQAVLPFPSLQIDPYRGMSPHFKVAAARGRAISSMAPLAISAFTTGRSIPVCARSSAVGTRPSLLRRARR